MKGITTTMKLAPKKYKSTEYPKYCVIQRINTVKDTIAEQYVFENQQEAREKLAEMREEDHFYPTTIIHTFNIYEGEEEEYEEYGV